MKSNRRFQKKTNATARTHTHTHNQTYTNEAKAKHEETMTAMQSALSRNNDDQTVSMGFWAWVERECEREWSQARSLVCAADCRRRCGEWPSMETQCVCGSANVCFCMLIRSRGSRLMASVYIAMVRLVLNQYLALVSFVLCFQFIFLRSLELIFFIFILDCD